MKHIFILVLFLSTISTYAQDDLLAALEAEDSLSAGPAVINSTWKSTYLINFHTSETEKKGVLDFRIAHRFGNIDGLNGGGHTLYGLDQASNIRFSFDYGITDDFQIGIGRSKIEENIDGLVKYKFLKQNKNGMPLSLLGMSSVAFTPKEDVLDYYSNVAHRFSYYNQIIISSKLNSWFSGLLNVSHFYRNLIVQSADLSLPRDVNGIFGIGLGIRTKLTRKLSLVGEYPYSFNELRNSEYQYSHPLSLGVEIETGGHVFHINLSNSAGLIGQDLINKGPDNWLDGEFKLGFTISRVFAI